MPVSYVPCILPFVLVALPITLLIMMKKRAALVAAIVCLSIPAIHFLVVFVPGWQLKSKAAVGDATAQYLYAQWLETHGEKLGKYWIVAPGPDVDGGYQWLEKAANQEYPPALWILGVRLKYGLFVPRPPNWTGPGGNVFPQPERGQALIDRALELGFMPKANEETYYWSVWRTGG